MTTDHSTLTPKIIVDTFRRSYVNVYRSEPQVQYVGNGWYRVNGELVHRVTVFLEIGRLRDIEQTHQSTPKSGLVRRLIAKLRAM
jgi:hypothetical protein